MPGIVISTAVRTGPTSANVTPTATAFFAGVAERGPSGTAQLISSFADYESVYGGFVASGYLHQSVKTYFEEGGSRCYISRVVADGSAKATKALLDGEATPATAMTLTAAGVGTWANSGGMTVQVINNGSAFRIVIALSGSTVFTSAYHSTVAAMVNEINNSSTAALYVTATDAGTLTLPATLAAANFSGGNDGTTVDGDNVVTALAAFVPDFGPGCVAAPGFSDASTYNGLIAHASTRNRIAILGFAEESSISDATTTAASYIGEDGGEEYAAFYHPWVKVPSSVSSTLTETIPCEAFIAAKRAAVQNAFGAWYPYAGEQASAKYVVGLESSVSKDDVNTLYDGYVNALRVVNGTVRVYGTRTISTDETNYKFLNARETLNLIVDEAERSLESFLFKPIDGRKTLFAEVSSRLTGIMERLRGSGGLYELINANGDVLDTGYSVIVSDTINPLTQIAEGIVKAKIGARVSPIGEQIELEITKSTLTATLI